MIRCAAIGIVFLFSMTGSGMAGGAEMSSLFIAKLLDLSGSPVEGASVFLYRSSDVKGPADFISPPSDREGLSRITLLPGTYWAVARSRKAGFGPIMPGDRHSGEAKKILISPDAQNEMDFLVASLREISQMKKRAGELSCSLTGRVIDGSGRAAAGLYVVLHRDRVVGGLPDFVSNWTDEDGRYGVSLPKGTYWVGLAREFPPSDGFVLPEQVRIEADRTDFDIRQRNDRADKNADDGV